MSDELLLTVRESAHRQRISTRHRWKMISGGQFGPDLIRLGRAVRIRARELADWIDAGCPVRDEWIRIRESQK